MSDALRREAVALAHAAGDAAKARYRPNIAVDIKGDGTPVTIADREAEATAREWVAARHPDDGIWGEELGELTSTSGRRWIIDPIDGTKAFIRGVPLWSTLVALAKGEEILAGAAYFPALGETVSAGRGAGCWWNDARCAASSVATLRDATVLASDARCIAQQARFDGWSRLAAGAALARTWGDAFGYYLVATGRAEVMVDPIISPWDVAPFAVIIEESGGVFTDWNGRATAFGDGAIATNRALATTARAQLGAEKPQ